MGEGGLRNVQRTFLGKKSICKSSLICLIFAAVEALLFTKTSRSAPMSLESKWLDFARWNLKTEITFSKSRIMKHSLYNIFSRVYRLLLPIFRMSIFY